MEVRIHNHNRVNRYFLKDVDILRYLLGNDPKLETFIIYKTNNSMFQTTDNELYRAFGSLKKYDEVERPRITKLFESVQITSAQKKLLTHEDVEELRKKAIKKGDVK